MAIVKKFLKQNFVAVCGSLAAVFVLGGFAWAFFALRSASSVAGTTVPLILHFNDTNGITSVGGLGTIVFMGLFGLLVVGMDFAIARELEKRGDVRGQNGGGQNGAAERDPSAARTRFLARFLSATTLLFAVLLFIAFAVIINVNV